MQTWVRFAEDWRMVAAYVSVVSDPAKPASEPELCRTEAARSTVFQGNLRRHHFSVASPAVNLV
jgi:hypothetical protein